MSHHFFRQGRGGFTLIEIIVSIGIMLVILSIILSNQSSYTEAAGLSNLADEIASTVTQAQVYGNAVRELVPGSADFSASYGLSLSLLEVSFKTSYLFFADRNGNEAYDGDWSCPLGGSSECLQKTQMLRGNYLDSICIIQGGGGEQCNVASRADVSFLRPGLAARITVFNSGGQSFNPGNLRGVRLVFKSPTGLTRSVSVYESGQVSVQ